MTWKHNRPLRLDGHAMGGAPFEDHHFAWAPVSLLLHGALLAAFVLVPLLERYASARARNRSARLLRRARRHGAASSASASTGRGSALGREPKVRPPETLNPNAFVAPMRDSR